MDGLGKIYGKEIRDKEGTRFMKVDKMLVDFKLHKSRFRVRDVINHGNIIGKVDRVLRFLYFHFFFFCFCRRGDESVFE